MITIKELKELDEKATRGPWSIHHQTGEVGFGTKNRTFWVTAQCDMSQNPEWKENQSLIMGLRNSLPELIERLEDADKMADESSMLHNAACSFRWDSDSCTCGIGAIKKYKEKWKK